MKKVFNNLKKRRNSTNKRKASPKKGSPAKRKQIRSPRSNRVSVGDRAGTSGLRNSPRRSFSPERSFYPVAPRGSRDPPRRSSLVSRLRRSFGAGKQSSPKKPRGSRDPPRRSSFGGRLRRSFGFPKQSSPKKPRGSRGLQLNPIAEGQQFQLSPAAEDAMNRVMLASRMETSPINTIQHEKPDLQIYSSLDTDPRVIHEVAMMMREAHLRDEFDINDFAKLGFSDYLLNAALQKSWNLLSESDKRRISEVQLKKKESLINKVSKEMAVELLNNNRIVGNKYLNRGIPSDVFVEAHEKAIIAKNDLLAMWSKSYLGIYPSPGSTRRKAKYTGRPENLKEQLSYRRIVKTLLDQYDDGNFYPDLPLNQQPFKFPSKYVVGPESYAKALNLFKRINALDAYNVDKTPAYTDSNYLKSPTNDITRSDVLGLKQRREWYNGGQFSPGEVKKLQKKITDMYEDGDNEEPIVEEKPEEIGDNFGLIKFDQDEQFETEHYGTDSDDDL